MSTGRADRDDAQLAALQVENYRLIALLEANGIEWRIPEPESPAVLMSEPSAFTPEQKLAIFQRLFRGRQDVYPVRWESAKTGKSGYSPACGNEWVLGVCEKPRIKCSECGNRQFLPVTDQTVYGHLTGRQTIGVYPLLADDTTWFLAVDFDEAEWREDAQAFVRSCREFDIPVALEISRSGNGAHAWLFFSSPVYARDARRLGSALISHTCRQSRQLKLGSYDRLFPNQDTMPKGGFGNLIALPLQKQPRESGFSVFVDDKLQPWLDQWAFLAGMRTVAESDIDGFVLQMTGGGHPLDVSLIGDEENETPWKRPTVASQRLPGPLPRTVSITLANLLYFPKEQLSQPLINRLIRLAAFQNPEFYKAQAMRFPVWDKPRIIGCAENYPKHIALPRGCLDGVKQLFADNGITMDLVDERYGGDPISVQFKGTLRLDQEMAATEMQSQDVGVLSAPTAFGKTVTAAAIIARRGVNTLVLVHRIELLTQWKERLLSFLGVGKETVGIIGGGKFKPTGKIDVAVMQSLSRQGEVDELVERYGQVIVDECHHLSAVSFEALLKRVRARYVLGLTATPTRRDGQQPIIFMQCGPVRHVADSPATAPKELEVVPRFLSTKIDLPDSAGIQEVFGTLTTNAGRNATLVDDVVGAYEEGRKVLVLTERAEHVIALQELISARVGQTFVLHGRMSRRQRGAIIESLDGLDADSPRVLLATGKLVGEGFDHPPLDTLVLAMPISWRGTLQQYAGRLHRDHATKTDVRIYDYVDSGHSALLRMWDKRQRGYKAMGYRFVREAEEAA
ncbi:MAG: DEAD/DEAH box helicase family protein [Burkholderiales bacterium]|nr:DEAD/DEAH box helicase family protein [Burkholderiales bacterium]